MRQAEQGATTGRAEERGKTQGRRNKERQTVGVLELEAEIEMRLAGTRSDNGSDGNRRMRSRRNKERQTVGVLGSEGGDIK